MQTIYAERAKVFKALCDEKRQRIIELLQSGEKCACVLLEELHITQSTLSHHMKLLCDSGIVDYRKEGKWIYYHITKDGSANALQMLSKYLSEPSDNTSCSSCEE